jgi:hypothetical protein
MSKSYTDQLVLNWTEACSKSLKKGLFEVHDVIDKWLTEGKIEEIVCLLENVLPEDLSDELGLALLTSVRPGKEKFGKQYNDYFDRLYLVMTKRHGIQTADNILRNLK